jgi:topoisomerase-4 subunit A
MGSKIKAEESKNDIEVNCSELDRLLLIFKDGLYKVINVSDKLFVGNTLEWMGVVENGLVFNVVYRNGLENHSYVKRFKTPKFIINREYRLFPEHKRSIIQFLEVGSEEVRARISLVPSSRARYNTLEIELDDYLIKAAGAKGKRVSNRVVRRVSSQTGKPRPVKTELAVLPGIKEQEKKDS